MAVRIRARLWMEAGALYRRLGYDTTYWTPLTDDHTATTANSWEVPILAKYRTRPLRAVAPFAAAGVAFRHIGGFQSRIQRNSSLPPGFGPPPVERIASDAPPAVYHAWSESAVVGVGLEFRTGRLLFSPEIRYNRWLQEGIGQFGSDVRSERNQVDFLLGVKFRPKAR